MKEPEDWDPDSLGQLLVELVHDESQLGTGCDVEELDVDMPMEFHVRTDEDGSLRLASSPPTQSLATTIRPVFHRVRVCVKVSARELPEG